MYINMFLYLLWNDYLGRLSIPQLTLHTPFFQVWFSIMTGAECFPIQINYWGYDMVNFFYPSLILLPEVHLLYCAIISLLLQVKVCLVFTMFDFSIKSYNYSQTYCISKTHSVIVHESAIQYFLVVVGLQEYF